MSATADEAKSQAAPASSEVRAVVALAAAVLALHLATNGLYDFHRDSLYYMDSARHPAWGYVDYPPVTPTIARLSLWLFGASPWGLRLWPSLAGAVMVVLTWLIARELGGGRAARLIAATGAATSLVLLGANWLFQTVTFDEVVWIAASWITARLIRTRDVRLWPALGLILGIGLETKYTVIAFIAGLAIGVVASPLRRHLTTPWPWMAAALALALFVPNLAWQATHAWPSVQYTFNHKSSQSSDFSPLTFLVQQLALIGPVAIPLWLFGLWWLLRDPGRRAMGIAAAVPLVVFLFVGKSYYVGPLHPVLIAAGACALERWRGGSSRARARVATVALTAQALLLLPLTLPVLPEPLMARTFLPSARTDFAATVGWHDEIAQVAAVYRSLPAGERKTAVILAGNYGEAGAINTYGAAAGLPTAYSGELSYYYWKPPSLDGTVVVVGLDRATLDTLFSSCTQVGTVTNVYGLQNEEYGAPLTICSGARYPLDAMWERLKNFA